MLIRDLGIIPARKAPDGAGEASPLVNLSRRGFMGGTGLFVLGVTLAGCSSYVEPDIDADAFNLKDPGPSPLTGVKGGDATPALWIAIERDGTVKITCHRSEMGQQTWTAMAQIVADELEAEWDKVQIVQAEGHERYGDQNTDGSRSVRFNFHRLRVAGAAMRQMLVAAAALYWKLPVEQCSAEAGLVSNTQNSDTLSYGNLAELAGKLAIPAEPPIKLKTPKEWRYISAEIPSLTVPRIVTGDSTYGIDVKRPGMVHAVVARPPQLFGKLGSVNDAKALAVPGVLRTVRLPDAKPPALFQPLGGVAVVARDTWAAIEGRSALEITWQGGPNAGYVRKASPSRCRPPPNAPARCAARAGMWLRRSQRRTSGFRLNITPRTSARPRWSRRARPPNGMATSSNAGPACRIRRAPAIPSPRHWGSTRPRSRSRRHGLAVPSGASPSPIS